MKGNVTGHYIAIKPDEVEKISSGGILLAEEFDSNLRARVLAAETTGVVINVGKMAWRAYDGKEPDWEPWAEVGDRVVIKRHTAKFIDDKDNLDEDGNPRKIFIVPDEMIIWNYGKADELEEEK